MSLLILIITHNPPYIHRYNHVNAQRELTPISIKNDLPSEFLATNTNQYKKVIYSACFWQLIQGEWMMECLLSSENIQRRNRQPKT